MRIGGGARFQGPMPTMTTADRDRPGVLQAHTHQYSVRSLLFQHSVWDAVPPRQLAQARRRRCCHRHTGASRTRGG